MKIKNNIFAAYFWNGISEMHDIYITGQNVYDIGNLLNMRILTISNNVL